MAAVNDADVAEEFVKNLLHVHTLAIREVFETELSAKVAEVRAADTSSESQDNAAKKIERTSLVETLRLTLRSPKMCPRCKYGPVENLNCSDLSAHHGQVMSAGAVAVNNSCPRCQYFSSNWSSWTDWDGRLPDETAGEWTATPWRPHLPSRPRAIAGERSGLEPSQWLMRTPCRDIARGVHEGCVIVVALGHLLTSRE